MNCNCTYQHTCQQIVERTVYFVGDFMMVPQIQEIHGYVELAPEGKDLWYRTVPPSPSRYLSELIDNKCWFSDRAKAEAKVRSQLDVKIREAQTNVKYFAERLIECRKDLQKYQAELDKLTPKPKVECPVVTIRRGVKPKLVCPL